MVHHWPKELISGMVVDDFGSFGWFYSGYGWFWMVLSGFGWFLVLVSMRYCWYLKYE